MKFSSVDDYIDSFPAEVQEILQKMRAAIHAAAPGAEEKIRYDMPAVMFAGRYGIHFAAWKKHVALYPVAVAPEPLESEIAPYRSGKDSLNFPYSKPIPYDLITRITAFLEKKHNS